MKSKAVVKSNSMTRLPWTPLIILLLSFAIVMSFSGLHPIGEVGEHASLDEFTAHLNQRIPALMKVFNIPGVNIALVHKGETVWSEAYGYADLQAGTKMTTDAYVQAGSISKAVTAWGVMKLVEQGRIELDSPVRQYIQQWQFPVSQHSWDEVTVRQLLTHTAGLPLGDIFERYTPQEDRPSLKESLSKQVILRQQPGSSFVYSNIGYNLLELLIEEVSGMAFAEYINAEIFIPLGMDNSSFTWSEDFNSAIPYGHDAKGKAVPVHVYPEKASGGLFASLGDIATFVSAGMTSFNHSDEALSPENIAAIYTPMVDVPGFYGLVFKSYGLGHFMESLNGTWAVSHGGQGYGWMTHFHSVPETGDGIVILTNSQRSWPFFAYILSDWGRWCGHGSVGMGKIILAKRVLWVFIAMVLFAVLWQAWRLGQALSSRHRMRQFAPLSKKTRFLRLGQGIVSLALVGGFFWSISQEYLFISAVFPVASIWLGYLSLVSAVTLMLSALFPRVE